MAGKYRQAQDAALHFVGQPNLRIAVAEFVGRAAPGRASAADPHRKEHAAEIFGWGRQHASGNGAADRKLGHGASPSGKPPMVTCCWSAARAAVSTRATNASND